MANLRPRRAMPNAGLSGAPCIPRLTTNGLKGRLSIGRAQGVVRARARVGTRFIGRGSACALSLYLMQ